MQELSRYYNLQKKLERNREMLLSLSAAAEPGAQALTGMPYSSGVPDKVGELVAEMEDLDQRILALEAECECEKKKLKAYTDKIDDDQTRMIFRLRFLHCMTWGEVAAIIGGSNSANSVKNICYRYLKSCVGVCRDDA